MTGSQRWVVLLRGVNVNGVPVTSAALRETCAGIGLERVRTVRASGNVVVDDPAPPPGTETERGAALKARVEAALRERFGYEAFVVVLAASELERVCAAYPFERADDEHHPYVVFSSGPGALEEAAGLAQERAATASGQDEQVRLAGDVLYWRCPKGSSTDTPVAKVLGAARWKPSITTRNLRTLGEVLAAAQD